MTSPDNTPLVGLSDADIMRMGVAALLRIAAALEAQQAASEEEVLTFPLSQYRGFDWSSIGAVILQQDADGVSVIRTSGGRVCKRRSNDKFGEDIWFSHGNGKDPDGTPKYRKVVEFKTVKAPEPLGRKTELAMKAATPAPAAVEPQKAESPIMIAIRARWAELLNEYVQLSTEAVPARFVLSSTAATPENQHRTDEFAQFVAGLRMAKADHAPAKAVSAPPVTNEPPPLEGARQWHAAAGRVSADNRAQLMEELQGWLRKLPACKIDLAKLSAQARMDEFGVWLKAQAVHP